jgi:hypothetical protein
MRTRHLLPVLGIALGITLTACGDDATSTTASTIPASSSGTPTTQVPKSPAEAALAFAQCMRDSGVSAFPDPDITDNGIRMTPGQGVDPNDPKVKAAQAKCSPILDQGGSISAPDEKQGAQLQQQVLAFAQCMREHRIDFPDPQVNGGRVLMGGGTGVDPNSPAFKSAQAACQSALPTSTAKP